MRFKNPPLTVTPAVIPPMDAGDIAQQLRLEWRAEAGNSASAILGDLVLEVHQAKGLHPLLGIPYWGWSVGRSDSGEVRCLVAGGSQPSIESAKRTATFQLAQCVLAPALGVVGSAAGAVEVNGKPNTSAVAKAVAHMTEVDNLRAGITVEAPRFKVGDVVRFKSDISPNRWEVVAVDVRCISARLIGGRQMTHCFADEIEPVTAPSFEWGHAGALIDDDDEAVSRCEVARGVDVRSDCLSVGDWGNGGFTFKVFLSLDASKPVVERRQVASGICLTRESAKRAAEAAWIAAQKW